MAIQRPAHFTSGIRLACAGLVVLVATTLSSLGQTTRPLHVLVATYDAELPTTPAEAEESLAVLEEALQQCTDADLGCRIQHRMAVMCLRVGLLDEARSRFRRLSDSAMCPEPIRLSSLSMRGQICRMVGADDEALEVFEELLRPVERSLVEPARAPAPAAILRLACLAVFGRAEIQEVNHCWSEAAIEYRRLLILLKRSKCEMLLQRYGPLATDRLSQLLLRAGEVDGYLEVAKALAVEHPRYRRAGLVELEAECIRFLRAAQIQTEFPNGSVDAPAMAVAAIRAAADKSISRQLLLAANELCHRYQGSYGGLVVAYHYAWILDVLGNKSKAAMVLGQILSVDVDKICEGPRDQSIGRTVQKYAGLQHAIVLAEHANYQQALAVLIRLNCDSCAPHVQELRQSVIESVKILQREVSLYGTD